VPSPFPGMNPYLEQEEVWHDFHQSFIPLAREVLSGQVGAGYIVKVEEHLFIHEIPASQRVLFGHADVGVKESGAVATMAGAGTLTDAPAYVGIPLAVDVERHAYLEVRDRSGREIITVLELLSPSNKNAGPDREQYIGKRQRILTSAVHLVEIDLLRGGPRMPLEGLPACDYYVLVSRAEERPRAGLWPIGLRDRLPVIPIPLRGGDQDVRLDLQQIVQRVYDGAHYERYIYQSEPTPALCTEDAAWARKLIGAGAT